MFPVVNEATHVPMDVSASEPSQTPPTNTQAKSKEVKESACFLTSVRNLRQSLVKGKHRRKLQNSSLGFCLALLTLHASELSEILEKHIFIGIVDIHKCLSLIQYSTKLYLVNHDALA
jgi:DNA mismatch repair protein MLH1